MIEEPGSKRGEERVKQAAARIRKSVPGTTGRNSPAMPNPKKTQRETEEDESAEPWTQTRLRAAAVAASIRFARLFPPKNPDPASHLSGNATAHIGLGAKTRID